MSDYHVKRLRAVEAEMEAMNKAAQYVINHWEQQSIAAEIKGPRLHDFRQAQSNHEITYFLRLYAEFEGLLKDHLATNHSHVILPRKPKVDEVIAAVVKAEGLVVDLPLRGRLNAVRDFRNSVAHSVSNPAPAVLFIDALRALNAFVAKLPAPKR